MIVTSAVLIPLNYIGGRWPSVEVHRPADFYGSYNVTSSDRLNWINVRPDRLKRYWMHLALAILFIAYFCFLIFHEMKKMMELSRRWIIDPSHRMRICANTVLIQHLPGEFSNFEELVKHYGEDNLLDVFIPRNFCTPLYKMAIRDETVKILEMGETRLMQNCEKAYRRNGKSKGFPVLNKGVQRASSPCHPRPPPLRRQAFPGLLRWGIGLLNKNSAGYSVFPRQVHRPAGHNSYDIRTSTSSSWHDEEKGISEESTSLQIPEGRHPKGRPDDNVAQVDWSDTSGAKQRSVSMTAHQAQLEPQSLRGENNQKCDSITYRRALSSRYFRSSLGEKFRVIRPIAYPRLILPSRSAQGYQAAHSYYYENEREEVPPGKLPRKRHYWHGDPVKELKDARWTNIEYKERDLGTPTWREYIDHSRRPSHHVRSELVPAITRQLPFIGKRTDTIFWARRRIAKLNFQIWQMQKTPAFSPIMTCAFIRFTTQAKAHRACEYGVPRGSLGLHKDVVPDEIVWENLGMSFNQRFFRTIFVYLGVACLTIFWCVPIAMSTTITQQRDDIICLFWWSRWLIRPAVHETRQIIQLSLPPFFVQLIIQYVPITIRYLAFHQGQATARLVELSVQNFLFSFIFFEIVIVSMMRTNILPATAELFRGHWGVLYHFAMAVPHCITFFYGYMILQALIIGTANLVQMANLVQWMISGFFDITPRQKWSRNNDVPLIQAGVVMASFTSLGCVSKSYDAKHDVSKTYDVRYNIRDLRTLDERALCSMLWVSPLHVAQ